MRRWAVLLCLLILAGCAAQPIRLSTSCTGQPPAPDPIYSFIDRQRSLAANRYLAARLPSAAREPRLQQAWRDWSFKLANEARQAQGLGPCELPSANLTAAQVSTVANGVPDEYSTLLRILGLYPLTRWPFVRGVKGELVRTADQYRQFADLSLGAGWRIWGSQSRPVLRSDNPLIEPVFRQALAAGVAADWLPYFAVQQGRRADVNRVIGLARDRAGVLDRQAEPALYWYPGFGEFAGRQTLQLNYQVWFRERPADGPWDPLAGRLDGLHWRVHLDQSLRPIAFDAMHTCGCWYQVFPGPGYGISQPEDSWQEPAFVGPVQRLARPLLLLAADTHALVGIRVPEALPAWSPLPAVLVSPAAAGADAPLTASALAYRRSFDERGRVPESARSERWYFWPMGIADAGSMRAPGHHAIAFTGRRHFDDPQLLNRLGLQRVN